MTPLNFLTQSAAIINDKVYRMFKQNQKIMMRLHTASRKHKQEFEVLNLKLDRIDNVCQENVIIAKNIIKMSEDNELSANSLWYHNQGQIKRIQIH